MTDVPPAPGAAHEPGTPEQALSERGIVERARSWPLGLDFGWVSWLPDEHWLLAGTGPGYLVDATTLAQRPVRMPNARARPGP